MKLIDILENAGLVSAKQISREIAVMPFRRLEEFREELADAVRANVPDVDDLDERGFSDFKFLASASFRGESGCSDWSCRQRKAEVLGRYAALFCDEVVFPIRFDSDLHQPSQRQTERNALTTSLLLLSELRPLIDHKVIVPVPSEVHYCPEHFPQALPESKKIMQARADLIRMLYSRIRVRYIPDGRSKRLA